MGLLTLSNVQWYEMYDDLSKIQGMDVWDAMTREWMAMHPHIPTSLMHQAIEEGCWKKMRDQLNNEDANSWQSKLLAAYRLARPKTAHVSDHTVIEWVKAL